MTPPIANTRKAAHPVDPIFTERWSPRSFTGEDLPVGKVLTILEAARWSPSSYNSQPWCFVWARRGTPHFDTFLKLLVKGNQAWAKDASAIVFVASSKTMSIPARTNRPLPHPFLRRRRGLDGGCLQAHKLGWDAHGMVGVDYEAAAKAIGLPERYHLDLVFSLGRRNDPAKLPEGYRAREAPNERRPLAETAFEGASPG